MRVKRAAWWVFIAAAIGAALALGIPYAARRLEARARADERARLVAENNAWTAGQLAVQRAYWSQVVDSLTAVVADQDSALARQLARARVVLATAPVGFPADTGAPAVTVAPAAAACMAVLDSLATACAVFRATATAALEAQRQAADSVRRVDSTAAARADLRARAAEVAQVEFGQRLARVQRGRSWERGACAASGALNLYTLWRLTK